MRAILPSFFLLLVILPTPFADAGADRDNWLWLDSKGHARTKEDLSRILISHALWVHSEGKIGSRAVLTSAKLKGADLHEAVLNSADLTGVDLSNANLNGAVLLGAVLQSAVLSGAQMEHADLRLANLEHASLRSTDLTMAQISRSRLVGADLTGVTLSGAYATFTDLSGSGLEGADLSRASLVGINLSNANLTNSRLDGADLTQANLSHTSLFGAHLVGVNLYAANLSSAMLNKADLARAQLIYSDLRTDFLTGTNMDAIVFQPSALPVGGVIAKAVKLETITYIDDSTALVQLRKEFQDGGFRAQERAITYALKRKEAALAREECWQKGSPICWSYWFNKIFFDLTCKYGLSPGNPLRLMVMLWWGCSCLYLLAMNLKGPSGVYLVGILPQRKGVSTQGIRIKPRPFMRAAVRRPAWKAALTELRGYIAAEMRLLSFGMFFSLMSATNIGFRDINFGRWLRLLTSREFDVRALGWVRIVAGFQSLISVYLVALWILCYFGRPFN